MSGNAGETAGQSIAKAKHPRKRKSTNSHHQASRTKKLKDDNIAQAPRSPSPGHVARDQSPTLLEEVRALGGDEEDFQLINDLDSDVESVSDAQNTALDESLRSEVGNFTKEIGLRDADMSPVEGPTDLGKAVLQLAAQNSKASLPATAILVFRPRQDWHATDLPAPRSTSIFDDATYHEACNALRDFAYGLLQQDTKRYIEVDQFSSSRRFLSSIMQSGTLSDKISALTLTIQESPVHNTRAIDALLNLASKRNRSQAFGALSAMVDLLGPGLLLPPGRRLRYFTAQPSLHEAVAVSGLTKWTAGDKIPNIISESHLVGWAFEDWLKRLFFKVIQVIEVWCNDEIEHSRLRGLELVATLLREKPEQEANLLRLLVNKLGDRERKVSSRASYLLLQLQNTHPAMKSTIVRAVDQEVLQRPGQPTKALYSAVNTLSQTILTNKDPETTQALLRIYFDMFAGLLRNGGIRKQGSFPASKEVNLASAAHKAHSSPIHDEELNDKLVAAILTGINRAAPFVVSLDISDRQIETLFRVAESVNFGTTVRSLVLIQQLSLSRPALADRFYRVLYESLLDTRLSSTPNQTLYLNLLLRALKADADIQRVKAFVKRIVQVLGLHQAPLVCGLLYVAAQTVATRKDLSILLDAPEESFKSEHTESNEHPRDVRSSDDRNSHVYSAILNKSTYDGHNKDPTQSKAHETCLWEILPSTAHFHPVVSANAATLIMRDGKVGKPDPASHSLIRFLDKFAYKKSKQDVGSRGTSIMQSIHTLDHSSSIWLARGRQPAQPAPKLPGGVAEANSVPNLAMEDVFFQEYFSHSSRRIQAKKPRPAPQNQNDDAEDDDIWDAMIDGYMPEASDVSDGDREEGLLDLDDYDDSADDSPWHDSAMTDDLNSSGSSRRSIELDEGLMSAQPAEKSGGKSARMLRNLPTFASAEDYAHFMDDDGMS